MSSQKEVRDALQISLDKIDSETAQRNCVVRAFAMLGHRTPPEITTGKLEGDTIRLSLWRGSPGGDVVLATGPAFKPRVFLLSEISQVQPGVYILAGQDRTKATERATHVATNYKGPRVRASVAETAREIPPPAARRVERAAAPVAARAKEAKVPKLSKAAMEMQAMQAMLAALA